MLRAGVIGYPIHHSLSPRLHGFWLKQYGIEGSYVTVEAVPEEFEKKLRELMEKGWRGVNVTLPHKETAAKLVDDGDDIVRTTGAANTLVFEGGKIRGTNTDVYGFIENLRQEAGDLNPYKKHALVLGAGGAARAVCAGLIQEGWERITLANRTRAKSHALADQFDGAIECVGWKQKEEVSADATLLVNTTSQGMRGQDLLDMKLDDLPIDALVTDIVYNPLQTRLLQLAEARGNKTVDGIGMLLHQAVPGFEAWFGVKPEVTREQREHVLEALG